MDDVANQVVTNNAITAAAANQGVISPSVDDLATECAVGVLGPNGHAQAAAEADLEERGRDMRVERIRQGEESGTCSGEAVEAEVGNSVTVMSSGIEQMMTNLGLNLGRQALLGRRTRRVVDASIGEKSRTKGRFNIGAQKAPVKVKLVERRPDQCA